MTRKKKAYRVVTPLPDGLGAVLVGGAVLGPGEDLPLGTDKKIIKDCVARELIEAIADIESEAAEQKVATSKKEWRNRLRPVSKWNINPVDLVGKTLVELNIMILEKDSDAEAFGDLNEALEYLSKDYEV